MQLYTYNDECIETGCICVLHDCTHIVLSQSEVELLAAETPPEIHQITWRTALDVFPEARPIVKRFHQERLQQYIQYESLKPKIVEICSRIQNSHDREWWEKTLIIVYVSIPQHNLHLDRYATMLERGNNNASIKHARRYPISSLIEFGRSNFAHCIFHAEKSPSLRYYPQNNTVYCFGCGRSADSIDVYRHLHGKTFLEAVKALS